MEAVIEGICIALPTTSTPQKIADEIIKALERQGVIALRSCVLLVPFGHWCVNMPEAMRLVGEHWDHPTIETIACGPSVQRLVQRPTGLVGFVALAPNIDKTVVRAYEQLSMSRVAHLLVHDSTLPNEIMAAVRIRSCMVLRFEQAIEHPLHEAPTATIDPDPLATA
ncbi:hypothetical protein FJZ48_03550 [Candidatus Uhrbacteria bacterium]|nr:hypothetical protein [Candidatus Uhrbacteria bacterium]